MRIGGILIKWVLVPAVFACLGYFIIGPKIGQAGVLPEPMREKINSVANTTADNSATNEASTNEATNDAPEIEITAEPAPNRGRRRR